MAMPEVEVPQGNIKKLSQKAVKRIDADVDGDVDTSDPKSSEMGEFVPDPTGKKKIKTKVQKESLSDWRGDLREVMTDTKDLKKVKEKKVKNKITINPKLGEAVEKIGGHLLEVKKVDGKIDIKKSDMGDVVKDFYKSDAPQFKGKTKEKRREMAIAAKLSTEQAGQDQNQEDPKIKSAQKKENQIKKRVLMQKIRAVRNNVQGIIAHNELDGEMVEGVMTMIGRKKKEKKAEKAMDAGARAKRKLARKIHAKYVSGSEENVPDDIREGLIDAVKKGAKRHSKAVEKKKIKNRKAVPYVALAAQHEPEGEIIEAKVDKGRSDYGKATIRNYRRSGPGHGEPAMFDPENKRGKLIDKRREEHKARRGVKGAKVPAYKVEEGSLHKWFKGSKSKDGKPGWVNVKTGGTCASDEPGEGTPKCVSSSKRASMTKAERESASRRKKAADPNQQQKSGAAKPTYVKTDIKEEDKKGKGSGTKDACYHKVKASAKVWPSAYASGRLVQCRKKGAANYGNKSEEVQVEGAAWTKKSGKNPKGGLNEKGRKSYERENPGSDLKAPSKKVGNPRRKSFCARMKGMKKKLTSAKTARDPDSRINKSLRAWNCGYEPNGTPIMEEDKAFNYVLAKLRKKHGDGVLTKGDKIKPPTAAQKKAKAEHEAKLAKERAAEFKKDPSQGRYPKGYSNRGSD